MKKIISLTLAVLMLCTLSIPVFAADITASWKSVTVSQDGNYGEVVAQGDADSPGKIVIEGGATVTARTVRVERYADLTVKSGATLRIQADFTMYDTTSSMTIEEGAKVELLPGAKDKWFYIPGTLTVAGELTGEIFDVDISKKGYGSIEVQGNGVIDLYCEMEQRSNGRNPEEEIQQLVGFLNKTDGNIVTRKDNRIIAEASHKFGEDERCVRCGALDPSHVHAYGADGKCICGEIDPNHQHNFNEATYTCACGTVQEHPHELDPNTYTCPCGYHEHNYDETTDVCPCGAINPNHNHDFANEKHTCLCGAVCAHVNGFDENGVCQACGHTCLHNGSTCDLCGASIENVEQIEEGDYILYTALNEKISVDISCGVDSTLGSPAVLWQNGSAKVFTISKNENGTYAIKNKATGYVLGVSNGSKADGTPIVQWTHGSSEDQQWVFEVAGTNHWYIRSVGGQYMSVKDSKAADGTAILSCNFTGAGNQMFKLVKADANGNPLNTGSALSEGNMAIIIAIAALVVGLGGGFFAGNVVTKKKTLATANGAPVANKNDEDDE